MNIEVPETVRQQANLCRNNFSCLASGDRSGQSKCKVHYSGGRNVLVLAVSEGDLSCPYCISFGERKLCTCPVNYHLHISAPYKPR